MMHKYGYKTEMNLLASVFLTIWHCILRAELTKTTPSDCFFGDFAHWVKCDQRIIITIINCDVEQ